MAQLLPLIVALSFAAGLNVYITVDVVGLLGRFGGVQLPAGLELLQHTWVLVACSVLLCVEFAADKIPYVDLVWNVLQTAVRIPVAALIAYDAAASLSPLQQALVTSLGAGLATIAHGVKLSARTAANVSPEPVSNVVLSTSEDIAAAVLSWVALRHPLASCVAALSFVLACILMASVIVRRLRRLYLQWRDDVGHTGWKTRYRHLRLGRPGRSGV